jgi:hypothetical protein
MDSADMKPERARQRNSETLNPKSERRPKSEGRITEANGPCEADSGFGLRPFLGFFTLRSATEDGRISAFGFQ